MRKKTVSLISLLAFCIATLGIIILNGCSSDGVVEASETPLNFTILTDSTVEVAETISHVEMREVILHAEETETISYVNIDSIIIPTKVRIDKQVYTVTGIENSAFCHCTGLTSITIPSSVINISGKAFDDCNDLAYIKVVPDNPNYSSLNGVLYNKAKTEIIKVPCAIIDSITIPSNVICINDNAFSCCKRLTSIMIPACITMIKENAFDGCESLENINVSPDNSKYVSIDGILYNKDTTRLIRVPNAIMNKFIIPSSVTCIGKGAFKGCLRLTDMEIPTKIKTIEEHAFENCENLNLKIKNSFWRMQIGENAFKNCKSVKETMCFYPRFFK